MNAGKKIGDNGLFQIGDVARCCGVSRQTVLFYERKGLISPTVQNESSGYRYYSAETVTYLIEILQLRAIGLSLNEIRDFFTNGTPAAEHILKSIEKKLIMLNYGREQMKSLCVKSGDYTVSRIVIPEAKYIKSTFVCHGIEEAQKKTYTAIEEAIQRGINLCTDYSVFAEYPEETNETLNFECFKMTVYIPVLKSNTFGVETLPEMPGISVCHRGDYSELGMAYAAIWDYVRENNLKPQGIIREYYIDSRSEYNDDLLRYVTRLVLPVKDF